VISKIVKHLLEKHRDQRIVFNDEYLVYGFHPLTPAGSG
jgi:hypothetical protein